MKVGYVKTSLIDYPGEVSSVIFLSGCNLRCVYCHNKGVVEGTGLIYTLEEVLRSIKKRKRYIKHIVVTGGEALLHGEALYALLRELKAEGFKVKLDTNGTRPRGLQQVLDEGLVDYVAMDIKGVYKDYEKITGVGIHELGCLKESIDILESTKIPVEFRTTVFKGMHTQRKIQKIRGVYLKKGSKYVTQRGTDVRAFDIGKIAYSEYNPKEYAETYETENTSSKSGLTED